MDTLVRPILVDVDTQLDFMCETGALYVPGAEAIVPHLTAVVQAARAAGIPHLSTLDTHTPDDPEFAAYGFPPHCVMGTAGWMKIAATRPVEGAIVTRPEQIGQGARETVFTKATFDVFTNPLFAPAVRALDPGVAIVVGVAADYCVKAAVLGLRALGVPVMIVEDAIAAVTPETGAQAIAEMRAAGVTFARTADVVAMLAGKQEAAHVA